MRLLLRRREDGRHRRGAAVCPLQGMSFDRHIETVDERLTVSHADEDQPSDWRVTGFPRLAFRLTVKASHPASRLVGGQHVLGFDLVYHSDFDS